MSLLKWLETIESYHYPRRGGEIGELVTIIAHAPAREQRVLDGAMAEIRELTADCLRARNKLSDQSLETPPGAAPTPADHRLAALCLERTACIESALVLMTAALLEAAPPPRARQFYPASLINDCLVLFHGPVRDAAIGMLLTRVKELSSAHFDAAREATQPIGRGFGEHLPWPTRERAKLVAEAMARLESVWLRAAVATWSSLRPKPKGDDRRRFVRAALSCTSARRAYSLLACERGWLRLLLNYKLDVLAGIMRWLRRFSLNSIVDVLVHEIAWPLDVATDAAFLPGEPAGLLAGPSSDSPRERKYLQRGRHRLLWADDLTFRAGLADVDPFCLEDTEFMDVMGAIHRRMAAGWPRS